MKTETSVKSKDDRIRMPFPLKVIWGVFIFIFLLNIVQGVRNFMAMRFGWSLLNFIFCLIYFFIIKSAYLGVQEKLKQVALNKEFGVQTVDEHMQKSRR